jgi:hypothetical protein
MSEKKKRVMNTCLKVYQAKNPEYRDLYATEFLFTEGSVCILVAGPKTAHTLFRARIEEGGQSESIRSLGWRA